MKYDKARAQRQLEVLYLIHKKILSFSLAGPKVPRYLPSHKLCPIIALLMIGCIRHLLFVTRAE